MKRLLHVLRGGVLSPPPVWLLRQAGRYLPEYRKLRRDTSNFLSFCYTPELAEEAVHQPLRCFDLDAAILFSDILVIPDALGQTVRFEKGHGPRLTPPIRDAESIKSLAFTPGRLDPVYDVVRALVATLPKDTALIGFAGAPWTVAAYMVEGEGSRDFSHARRFSCAEPEVFGALMERITEATVAYLLGQIEAGAEAIQLFDSWAGVLAPGAFAAWVAEPTRKIVTALKARYPDVPVIGYPRGAGILLPDYVHKTGVDAVGVDERTPITKVAEMLPGVPLQGNLDPLLLVTNLPAALEEARRILDAMQGKPFIFNLGHGILPDTPPEHVAALCEMVRRK